MQTAFLRHPPPAAPPRRGSSHAPSALRQPVDAPRSQAARGAAPSGQAAQMGERRASRGAWGAGLGKDGGGGLESTDRRLRNPRGLALDEEGQLWHHRQASGR